MMGSQRSDQEPSAADLLDCFQLLDSANSGRIPESQFRRMMGGRAGEKWELEEMLAEYRRLHTPSLPPTPQVLRYLKQKVRHVMKEWATVCSVLRQGEEYIDYRRFVAMLQE